MKLKNTFFAAAATLGLIAAQPAWAQSGGPVTETVPVLVEIAPSDLELSIIGAGSARFGMLRVPNGTTEGAQCRYQLLANSSTGPSGSIALAELRNANVFDQTFPTPSGCQATGTTNAAFFNISCTPSVPVTFRAEVASAGLAGVLLQGMATGYVADSTLAQTPRVNVSANSNSTFACPDGGASVGQFTVFVGASVILSANAATSSLANVGTITFTATY
jgi:hypothetical protein